MANGAAWKKLGKKWVAEFDPNSIRTIPISWVDFLADIDSDHASHEFIMQSPLLKIVSSFSAGVIRVTVRVDPDLLSTVKNGQQFFMTCRLTADNGEIEDQTVYLKMTSK